MLQVRIRRYTGEIRKVDRSIDLGIDNQPGLLESEIGIVEASVESQIQALRNTFKRILGAKGG